jgi:hypothetical protein
MINENSVEHLAKIIGQKKPGDVWDELHQLNALAASLELLLRAVNDGYPAKKTVGPKSDSTRQQDQIDLAVLRKRNIGPLQGS